MYRVASSFGETANGIAISDGPYRINTTFGGIQQRYIIRRSVKFGEPLTLSGDEDETDEPLDIDLSSITG